MDRRSSRPGSDRSAKFPSPEGRIRRRTDYRRCYERGRRRHGRYSTVHVVENNLDGPRLGITVTRKVGGAVVRNRVKRRLREIYRRWSNRPQLPDFDIVIHAKPAAAIADFSELTREVERQLQSLLPRRSEV